MATKKNSFFTASLYNQGQYLDIGVGGKGCGASTLWDERLDCLRPVSANYKTVLKITDHDQPIISTFDDEPRSQGARLSRLPPGISR